jgi:hypothetical protein
MDKKTPGICHGKQNRSDVEVKTIASYRPKSVRSRLLRGGKFWALIPFDVMERNVSSDALCVDVERSMLPSQWADLSQCSALCSRISSCGGH